MVTVCLRSTVVVGVAVLMVVDEPSNMGRTSVPSQSPTAVVEGPVVALHELPALAFKVVLVALFQ